MMRTVPNCTATTKQSQSIHFPKDGILSSERPFFLPSKRPSLAAQKTAFHNVLNHKAWRNREFYTMKQDGKRQIFPLLTSCIFM